MESQSLAAGLKKRRGEFFRAENISGDSLDTNISQLLFTDKKLLPDFILWTLHWASFEPSELWNADQGRSGTNKQTNKKQAESERAFFSFAEKKHSAGLEIFLYTSSPFLHLILYM